MSYRIIIDESLHMTKYQRSQVGKILRTAGASRVEQRAPTCTHHTEAKFHREINAVFREVDQAKSALRQIGLLKLGGWSESWQVVDGTVTPVLLSPNEIADISTPLTGQGETMEGREDDAITRHELWHTLMDRQNYECYVCGLSWKEQNELYNQSFDIHRVLPGHSGGQYTLANTIMVCHPCHDRVQDLNLAATNRIRSQLRG